MAERKKVLIASDHAGFELKAALQKILHDVDWIDLGPVNNARVDYPDYADRLARKVAASSGARTPADAGLGVLICGSGIGMSIAANKVPGIRAAVVENTVAARLSREHNDANVLCLGARFLAPEYAAELVQVWLATPFTQDPRHWGRIQKIMALEASGASQ